MKELEELIALCKGEVHVVANSHTVNYHTVEDELAWLQINDDEIDPEVRAEMNRRQRMVHVQAYPDTPIGFFVTFHYEAGPAIKEMLEIVRKDRQGNQEG